MEQLTLEDLNTIISTLGYKVVDNGIITNEQTGPVQEYDLQTSEGLSFRKIEREVGALPLVRQLLNPIFNREKNQSFQQGISSADVDSINQAFENIGYKIAVVNDSEHILLDPDGETVFTFTGKPSFRQAISAMLNNERTISNNKGRLLILDRLKKQMENFDTNWRSQSDGD